MKKEYMLRFESEEGVQTEIIRRDTDSEAIEAASTRARAHGVAHWELDKIITEKIYRRYY